MTQPEGLQLRSLIKPEGVLELSLVSEPIPEPRGDEVVIRVEAAPLNPSDMGLLFGGADMTTARATGAPDRPLVTADVTPAVMRAMAARIGQSLPVGNEGAGTVVKAGESQAAQGLLAKTVALVRRASIWPRFDAAAVWTSALWPSWCIVSKVDESLAAGRLDRSLPYLKREALRLLGMSGEYSTDPATLANLWSQPGWFERLRDFYFRTYPEVAAAKEASITAAIDELRRISGLVLYADMQTNWLTYPDNLGHGDLTGSGGCFRCHTQLVRSDSGERLAGGTGGTGCLACHGLSGSTGLISQPMDNPECAYCHASIPVSELERYQVP